MEFRILGPLEVSSTAGSAVALPGGKRSALLAVLLLNLNRAVPVSRLVDDLWGAEVPDTATKAVQIYVSQLRKALPEQVIHTRPPGYMLALEPDQVDLYRFERLVAEGREALAAGTPERASELLRNALLLWRGPALAEFAEPFAEVESAGLEELQLSALEERLEADLGSGRHAELVGELDALLRRHPTRERLRSQQMTALYRAGRQAEALACYQDFRRLLDDEVGIEPSARLRELERRILRQAPDLDLDPGAGSTATPAAPLAAASVAVAERGPELVHRPQLLVGRQIELGRLERVAEEALAGSRRLVFVSGDAGTGKTTLVEGFLARLDQPSVQIARVDCTDSNAGEPYLPVLEALAGLCRGGGEASLDVLRELAPSWLLQMPWLVEPDELQAIQARARSTSRERMLREIAEALAALGLMRPVVLVLEDLHLADHPTAELIALLGRRPEQSRLLVVATYRPDEARASRHPLPALVDQLTLRGLGHELTLAPLDAREYIRARFPGTDPPDELATLLAERTRGNPLFMGSLIDAWLADGAVVADGGLRMAVPLETIAGTLPRTLRSLIEGRLSMLDEDDRELLEISSVAGPQVAPGSVAAALGLPEQDVERRLTAIARVGLILEAGETVEWPDGTVAAGFGFVHELYQQVLYELVPAARRVEAHRRIGARLEEAFGARAAEIGGQLATHFVRGHEPARAVHYLRLASEQAFRRNAYEQAIDHARAALDALGALSDKRAAGRLELELQSLLGQALVGTEGWSSPEAEQAFARARDLAVELGDNEPLAPVLLALATIYEIRGDFAQAEAVAEEFRRQVPDAPPKRRLQSSELLACSLFHQGSFARALDEAERGVALFAGEDGHFDTFPATLGDNAGISCHAWAALALWFLGYPEQALERARNAVDLAADPSHSYSLAPARAQLAILHQCRREPEATLEWAEATIAVATDRGYAYRVAMGRILRGWALSALGQFDEGIRELERGLLASRATGAHMDDAYFLGLLAEARLSAGRVEAGLAAAEEALATARRERSSFAEAELLRLRGELAFAAGDAGAAEPAFVEALDVAGSQNARSLELRIAHCLAVLRGDEASRNVLARVHGTFTEGFETPELRQAAALLSRVPGAAQAPFGAAPSTLEAGGLLPESPAAEPPGADGRRAERRHLTILACQLGGMAELVSRLDPEDLSEIVDDFRRRFRAAVTELDGHVALIGEDAATAYFGYPRAHEDDARRAIRAALAIQAGLADLALRVRQRHGLEITSCAGVHSGDAVVQSGADGVGMALGETPRIAVALAREAADEAVVVSGETHRLVRGCFSFRALRELEIEGAAAPVRLLEVTAEAETGRPPGLSAPRGLTPVVGREGELALLLDRWQQAVAGNGQAVVLVGEAGIGKSRLALDLVEQVGPACTRIELRCSPYHEASALHPIVEHLQRLVGADADQAPRRQLARLERAAAAAGIGSDGTAVLGTLLGVRLPDELARRVPGEPRDLKQRTHELLADWLGALARRRPVLVLLEDLQWADPSTLELLDVVLADLPGERVLTVATCRPDTQFAWPARSFVTQLTLCRLSAGDTSRLVHDILGGMELPADLLQEVLERTDGVPLFVEELLKTILDTGLVEKEGDRLVRRSPEERLAFPETLQDSLMARLDRLGPAKAIAQVASVFGREVSYELIEAVAPIDSSRLSDALAILVQAELLERRGRPPHSRFAFRHALVQETAYRSLLRSERRDHHRDAAEALEARFPELAASQPELVAHHYTEAGLAERAVPFWLRAGERAVARSANREAVEHLGYGIELIESLPAGRARSELELALRVPLGHALIADGGYAAAGVEQAYARIRDLAREVGEPERVGPALFALWMNYVGRGMHESARDTGEELLESGSSASADPVVYVGHRTVGWPLFLMGDLAGARAHLEQMTVPAGPDARGSLARYGADPVMAAEVYAAWTLCLLGGADEARGRAERALELARSGGHPTGLAYALGMAAIFHQFLGEAAEAAALAREGIEVAGDHGLKVWQGWCGVALGWALVQTGEPEAGALEIAAGVEVARRAGTRLFEPYCLALLAEAQGQAGRPSRGLELLDEALTIAGSHRELYYEAEMHRLRGDLLLRSDPTAARQALERAAHVAHTQGARLFELRAAESLARLSA